MLFKKIKKAVVFSFLILVVFAGSVFATCGSCPGNNCSTEKSLEYIRTQINILETINPGKSVETGAKAIQNILCEMGKMKFSESGSKFAKLSEGYFRKTLANLGKLPADNYLQACFVTYPFSVYYFGKLYRTELNQNNPFKNVLWFYIERQLKSAKASITRISGYQLDPDQFAKQQSVVYQKAANHLKVLVKFVSAVDCLDEAQRKQVENLFRRCQFDYAQKDYTGFNKNFALLEAALLRLKGIISADNC